MHDAREKRRDAIQSRLIECYVLDARCVLGLSVSCECPFYTMKKPSSGFWAGQPPLQAADAQTSGVMQSCSASYSCSSPSYSWIPSPKFQVNFLAIELLLLSLPPPLTPGASDLQSSCLLRIGLRWNSCWRTRQTSSLQASATRGGILS